MLDNTSGSWKVVDSKATIRPIFDKASRKSVAAAGPYGTQTIGDVQSATLEYVRNKVAVSSAHCNGANHCCPAATIGPALEIKHNFRWPCGRNPPACSKKTSPHRGRE